MEMLFFNASQVHLQDFTGTMQKNVFEKRGYTGPNTFDVLNFWPQPTTIELTKSEPECSKKVSSDTPLLFSSCRLCAVNHESAPTGPILLFYFLLHSFCCMASLLCTLISCLWTQSCASSSAEHFPALAQIKSTAFAHGSHGNCRHWTTTNDLFNHAQLGHTTRSGSFPDIIQCSRKQALCPIS